MNYARMPLAELAINIPMATSLFRKNRLDFCCGGKQTLEEACQKKNLNVNEIVIQLRELEINHAFEFESGPLDNITHYIVLRYHLDLKKRFPELIALANKVEKVHLTHADCPTGLTALLQHMHQEMLQHMMKEENILFPLIESGKGSLALMPVKVMMAEHEAHGDHLESLHVLTNDFNPPDDACPTWQALYKGLEKLEEELMEHIHLENNILFPRALVQKGA